MWFLKPIYAYGEAVKVVCDMRHTLLPHACSGAMNFAKIEWQKILFNRQLGISQAIKQHNNSPAMKRGVNEVKLAFSK